MTTYTLDHPEKGLISYTDKKRYLWLTSVLMPIVPMMGIFAYFQTGSEWSLALPLAVIYLLIPFMDWALFEVKVVAGYKILMGNYALNIGHHSLQVIGVSLFPKVFDGWL